MTAVPSFFPYPVFILLKEVLLSTDLNLGSCNPQFSSSSWKKHDWQTNLQKIQMPYRIFVQTFPHLKVDLQTKVSMVPSPRLVFPQVPEYLLQKDVNTGLKSLGKSGCKSNKGDCYIPLQISCRKLFMYFKRQCPLLHKWLYMQLWEEDKGPVG